MITVVRRELVREGKVAHWIDGRLPPKPTLIYRTTIREMLRSGVDHDTLINNPLYKRSYRCKLDRYEYFIQLTDLFIQSHKPTREQPADYMVWLLDPFTEVAEKPCLARELAEAEMYHKNKKNFRALLLLSNTDHPAEVGESIEQLASIAPFILSPAQSFKDYARFQEHLDRFLFDVIEVVGEPSAIEGYLRNSGFRTECCIYRKS